MKVREILNVIGESTEASTIKIYKDMIDGSNLIISFQLTRNTIKYITPDLLNLEMKWIFAIDKNVYAIIVKEVKSK